MISVGIDVGAKTAKVIVLRDNEIIARNKVLSGFEAKENTIKLFEQVISDAGITRDQIDSITSTGSGRKEVDFATHSVTDVTAAAKGAHALNPNVRTVIDIGAEEGRGIRCDERGKIIDFAIN